MRYSYFFRLFSWLSLSTILNLLSPALQQKKGAEKKKCFSPPFCILLQFFLTVSFVCCCCCCCRRAEPEEMAPDSLTCGVCRKEFPLGEIVRFIQHKVLSCNKENYRVMCARSGRTGPPDGDNDNHPAIQIDAGGSSSGNTSSSAPPASVGSRRPSISAPINSRRLMAGVSAASATEPDDAELLVEGGAGQSGSLIKAEGEEDRAAKGPTTADAGSNTINSGKKTHTSLLTTKTPQLSN